ncbi:MAG: recombinase family protein [Solirubrobacteraceae bacterium]
MSTVRFAFYGRLSTDDRQDVTLARPSQLEACERKAAELGGEIVVEFFDQESGAKDDRPGWTSLTQEARNRDQRRFDAVVIYQTSRLSRDRVSAGLFHRELRKHGVQIHYVVGAGDPSTPEGGFMIAMQQAFDEYERAKLSRETKRGMRQNTLNGYRCGGRAPYGYQLERLSHPVAGRASAGDTKTKLTPDPDLAPVVAEIFHLWAIKGWGCKAIADHLNRPGGPPSPSHVDPKRNLRSDWAKSTIRSMLRNPTYTGRLVWNRHDFATKREAGGTARIRAQDEWVISEVEHLPLISDELFAQAQERFRQRSRPKGLPRGAGRAYLFSGMVKCASGHQPLAMHGKTRKDHTYLCCDYGRSYGKEAAEQIDGHGQWLYLREDHLIPLVEQFFAQRIFGPMRLEKLARQLRTHQRHTTRTAASDHERLRKQISDLDRRIGLQLDALERGIEPELIGQRVAKHRAEKEDLETRLRAVAVPAPADASDQLEQALARIPDLTKALQDAPPALKRQIFDAFELRITYDRQDRRIGISATISDAVAKTLQNANDLPQEVANVTHRDIAGAGFEPATFGL